MRTTTKEFDHTGRFSIVYSRPPFLSPWVMRNACVFALSLLALSFWSFRHAEQHVARRLFSVVNVNDFSAGNRGMAAVGAFQMMAEKASTGFGWNESELVYDYYYRVPKVLTSQAIRTNGYLVIGVSVGFLALGCFLAYIWLSLKGARDPRRHLCYQPQISSRKALGVGLNATCRASALVLLVGFCFDGGLFRLATGATFWVLVELGATCPREADKMVIGRRSDATVGNPAIDDD